MPLPRTPKPSAALARWVERAWYGSPGLLWLLLPLEGVFFLLMSVRRQLFSWGWKRSVHPGVPVLIVGNINAGGTGKTPVVIAIVLALLEAGFKVAVVSRGYGGSGRVAQRLTVHSDATQVGDEAVLIFAATGADVVVGSDRVAAACLAADLGAEVIVCDDGLQHYALARDLEILTLDAKAGFGNGHLLPVGPLREPVRRIDDVDFLLQRDGDDPRTATRYLPEVFRSLDGSETRAVEAHGFTGPVHAVAAIARPQRFFATLRALGIAVIEHPFPDHHVFSPQDLSILLDHPIVVTAKDAVKLPVKTRQSWVLHMQLVLPEAFMQQLIVRVEALIEEYA